MQEQVPTFTTVDTNFTTEFLSAGYSQVVSTALSLCTLVRLLQYNKLNE